MEFNEKRFLNLISKTLFYGVLISIISMIFGFLLKLFFKDDFYFINLGLITLILTPILRIAMLLIGFCKLKEYNFALSSFIVLVLMFISFLI